MPTNFDNYRAAKLLIDQRGDDVTVEAAMRADEMLDKGDLGVAVWLSIRKAVQELQRTRAEDTIGMILYGLGRENRPSRKRG